MDNQVSKRVTDESVVPTALTGVGMAMAEGGSSSSSSGGAASLIIERKEARLRDDCMCEHQSIMGWGGQAGKRAGLTCK